MPQDYAIETRGIRKEFGGFVAVGDTSFEVREGEDFALLGPNGAGKSTLIRMLTTLVLPTRGTALVNGADVLREPDRVREAIGVVPQALTSDPDLTAAENLDFCAKLYGVPGRKRSEVIERLLAWVDLLEWRNKLVGTFSGGMRRRLEIGRSLMHEPRVLFLDEPTTGLDPASRLAMWEMLRGLKSRTGLTLFLTTHYMEEADRLCSRVAIFDHGRVVALDTTERLKAGIPQAPALEAAFEGAPGDWRGVVEGLPGVEGLEAGGDGPWLIRSRDRAATMSALLDAARERGVALTLLRTRGTTLEDVFIHYTGRSTRDSASETRQPDARYVYQPGAR